MNIKELFSKDRLNKKKLVEFFDKKGFYIVLVLCIVIVGATAVFVTTRNISSGNNNEDKLVSNTTKDAKAAVDVSSKTVVQSSTDSTKKDSTASSAADASKDTAKTSTAAEVVKGSQTAQAQTKSSANAAPANPEFASPVFGQVTNEFSKDKLTYSKTLDQWMTHEGVDISSERGTQVKAVAGGIVSDIKNDPRLGVVVEIDHQNGYKTKYGNLAADDMVTVNQKIKKGDVIGSIGNTALYEVAEAPHLHFEVVKNNASVDPNSYLPKN